MKNKHIYVLALLVFLTSCINKKAYLEFVYSDNGANMKSNIALRTDGYYYYESFVPDDGHFPVEDTLAKVNHMHGIILYKDGTVKYNIGYPITNKKKS